MQACLPTATANIDYNIGLLDVLAKKPSLMSARFRVKGHAPDSFKNCRVQSYRAAVGNGFSWEIFHNPPAGASCLLAGPCPLLYPVSFGPALDFETQNFQF